MLSYLSKQQHQYTTTCHIDLSMSFIFFSDDLDLIVNIRYIVIRKKSFYSCLYFLTNSPSLN